MAKDIKPEELATTITKYLDIALEDYTDIMKEVIDETAEKVVEETKSHITFHDKEYSKSIALSDEQNTKRSKKKLWYVKSPHYRLTHLLEFGHITRNGTTRTRAYPHVEYGQKYVSEHFANDLKERIENAKLENIT